MSDADQRLPRRTVAGYALGSLGSGVYSTVPTVLLLYFCTEILGIHPATAAMIVFLPKAWALLWDPIVGAWSDRTRSRHGRRAPFIAAGAVGITLSFPLLFNVPALGPAVTALYVMAIYFAMATMFSVFAVPYAAVPAEIGTAVERERLLLWRMVCSMAGVLIGAGIAPHLVELAGGGRHGYSVMSLTVAAACGLAMCAAYLSVRRLGDARTVLHETTPLLGRVRRVMANREYAQLWIAYLLATSGVAMFLSMVPYFVTHLLRRPESDAGTALIALLSGTICALPLWGRALKRWDGWRALLGAVFLYLGTSATFWLLPEGLGLTVTLPVFFLLGVPFAGLQLLPFALLAHLTHADSTEGARNEGLYTGIWTAGEKMALALGPAAVGLGLAWAGYVSGTGEQEEAVLQKMHMMLMVGPAVFLLPAMLIVALRVLADRARSAAGRSA